ncbi:hypothetical protein [Paracoccus phage vB_PmaS-R3]|uniref:Uncharacterized protein n=1 Tax=Paracoccus phage vB_PmaS-R3 TaxID=2494563 RepID=A0A0B5A7J4_9CAUD|nr:hypothetical protein VC48_gp27 [Paracoccus phage vB_PmaS-R3]AJD83151.1 hypothetical protein [Paracoccus phage vB_PmaS-R3]
METIADMKARARAQDAYGKWNTAPLWNEIARREDEARSPLHRFARRVAGFAGLALLWALSVAPFVIAAKNLFVSG